MKRKLRTALTVLLGSSLLAVLYLESQQIGSEETEFTSSIANFFFQDNFHPVVKGRLYRAAEMPNERLAQRIKENQIATVIDLRLGKEEAGETEEQLEADIVRQNGAEYVHFPLRGSRTISPERLQKLLELFEKVQYPVLVHCTSGTHRSGVVAAIWMLEKDGAPIELAEKQLSPRFGFFRSERALKSYFQGHPTIDNVIWIYGEKARESGMTFREWVASLTT